jgi:hypothetical protein
MYPEFLVILVGGRMKMRSLPLLLLIVLNVCAHVRDKFGNMFPGFIIEWISRFTRDRLNY